MSKRLTKAILFSFLLFGQLHCFNNFFELKQYVQEHEEYPAIDNSDRLNPDYSSFHKKNLTGWFAGFVGKALGFLRLKKPPLWSARQFKDLLEGLARKREQNSYYGKFIQKFTPKSGTRFVLWSDMHGALHSLTRDLVELKNLGAIDDDFKLSKDHFLLFNGDLILHSPYILETLTLVMRLMEVNPDKVFYLRGSNEEKENWHGHGLQRELEIRARHLSDEKIPLNSFVKKFFMTLPMALYLRSNDKEKPSILRISHFGNEKEALNEENYSGFLHKEDDGKPKLFKLNSRKTAKKEILLRANIKSVVLKKTYKKSKGLQLLPKEGKTTDWALLSSPTSTYRIMYEFFNDAFCILEVFSDMEDWTISLYWQDVREMKGFEKTTYNLLSGELISQDQTVFDFTTTVTGKQFLELQKKVEALEKRSLAIQDIEQEQVVDLKPKKNTQKEIIMGCSLWLSAKGGFSMLNKNGQTLAINKFNREGGKDGQRLKLIFLDDKYNPGLARKNINKLLTEYGTNMILSPSGSSTVRSYFDFVREKKILVMFPTSGADIFRVPEDHIVHFRASYSNETKALLEYALEKTGAENVAIFYQDDAYGRSGLAAMKKILKQRKIKKSLDLPYKRHATAFTEHVKKLKEYAPDFILFFATDKPATALIRQAGASFLAKKILLGPSPLAVESFKTFVRSKGLSFIFSHITPNVKTSNFEIVKEFREEAKKKGVSLDQYTLHGYINASIAIDILKKVKGEVTKEKMIGVINNIKDYDFKGLTLNLDPETRELSKIVWLETEEGEWLKQEVKN